jgi:multiple sugar transport system ATP-binding protein
MDEPLSNLDAKLRVIMRAELRHLQQQLGVTTIYVTHDQAEAMTLADKLIVMDAGRIQQVGKSEDVYRYPQNKFVAGFIGSPPMNFIDCRLDMTQGTLVCDAMERKLDPNVVQAVASQGSDKRILGVRPEDLTAESTPSPGAIQGRVYVMEQLGREILLNAMVGDEMVRAFVPADCGLESEQQVWLTFLDHSLHIFDGETEETLYSGNRAPA